MEQGVTTKRKLIGEISLSEAMLSHVSSRVPNLAGFQEQLGTMQGKPITEIIDFILASAVYLKASDIHFEPTQDNVQTRLRIDGILHDAGIFSSSLYEQILSRLKLVSSGIKLNITDRPQDGRFSFLLQEKTAVEVRVSTLPSEYGESLVMRVLNPQSLVAIEELGLREDLLDVFQNEIKKPNGMIIVTGPTGSGKTTTLYAFLRAIRQPEIKIITIEDPIEYHLEGISQTQVNPSKGYDFATGLQAIVRQDPDVILVGEIRDEKTAEIALQAALTGHFVLATLHTNDAAGAFSRLLSLGAKLPVMASAANLIIAQRLVRKLCQQCKELAAADEKTEKEIIDALKDIKKEFRPEIAHPLLLPKAKGCGQCNFTGYKGRIGIFEAIAVTEKMESFVLKSPSTSDIQSFAVKEGMIPMRQDGLLKVLRHMTTLEEIERETAE
ncbi:MAG: type II/IV secretion system protein [Candidatus Wildermuthbacteria bacterium]|nr:type II/IV secretion system protein [Candidatus Wildermuthbacteria bacterium]